MHHTPSDVGSDEGDTNTHDDGEGLEGDVVLERLDGQALHQPQIVVWLQGSVMIISTIIMVIMIKIIIKIIMTKIKIITKIIIAIIRITILPPLPIR